MLSQDQRRAVLYQFYDNQVATIMKTESEEDQAWYIGDHLIRAAFRAFTTNELEDSHDICNYAIEKTLIELDPYHEACAHAILATSKHDSEWHASQAYSALADGLSDGCDDYEEWSASFAYLAQTAWGLAAFVVKRHWESMMAEYVVLEEEQREAEEAWQKQEDERRIREAQKNSQIVDVRTLHSFRNLPVIRGQVSRAHIAGSSRKRLTSMSEAGTADTAAKQARLALTSKDPNTQKPREQYKQTTSLISPIARKTFGLFQDDELPLYDIGLPEGSASHEAGPPLSDLRELRESGVTSFGQIAKPTKPKSGTKRSCGSPPPPYTELECVAESSSSASRAPKEPPAYTAIATKDRYPAKRGFAVASSTNTHSAALNAHSNENEPPTNKRRRKSELSTTSESSTQALKLSMPSIAESPSPSSPSHNPRPSTSLPSNRVHSPTSPFPPLSPTNSSPSSPISLPSDDSDSGLNNWDALYNLPFLTQSRTRLSTFITTTKATKGEEPELLDQIVFFLRTLRILWQGSQGVHLCGVGMVEKLVELRERWMRRLVGEEVGAGWRGAGCGREEWGKRGKWEEGVEVEEEEEL